MKFNKTPCKISKSLPKQEGDRYNNIATEIMNCNTTNIHKKQKELNRLTKFRKASVKLRKSVK